MLTRSPRSSLRVRVTTRLQFAIIGVALVAACTPHDVIQVAAHHGVALTTEQAQAVADRHNADHPEAVLASIRTDSIDPATITPEMAKAIAWTALVVEQQKAAAAGPNSCHDGVCPTADQWAKLRNCESGNNPASRSPGGKYMGLYQFDQRTWNGTSAVIRLGYRGVAPSAAPRSVQDAAAADLYQDRGWRPWPLCGRFLR